MQKDDTKAEGQIACRGMVGLSPPTVLVNEEVKTELLIVMTVLCENAVNLNYDLSHSTGTQISMPSFLGR